MFQKVMNARKKSILLRLVCTAFALTVLLSPLFVTKASAESIDYNDYITNIVVDGANDICTVEIPFTGTWQIADVDGSGNTVPGSSVFLSGNDVKHTLYPGYRYSIGVYPFGNTTTIWGLTVGSYVSPNAIDLTDLPAGATFQVFVNVGVGNGNVTVKDCTTFLYYVNEQNGGFYLGEKQSRYANEYSVASNGLNVHINSPVISLEKRSDAFSYAVWLGTVNVGYAGSTNFACKTVMTFSISSAYREYAQSGKNAALMKAIEKQLEQNGQTLQEVLDAQQQTNNKLDDMQGSIDELPDKVGDEIQGVIENEKQEAEDSGNKFVDEILDALPDPSVEVLSALRGLTNATSYTGTKAALTIPPIVLPGIDGLFPSTEIWGGAQFDFGEYIGFLPSNLLTLVQSLFTIAIVLFCVYELKGVISYCLTLRSNKGD